MAYFDIILKASITTWSVVILRCYILLISIPWFLYLLSCSSVFKDWFLSAGTATSIRRQVFLTIMSGQFIWIFILVWMLKLQRMITSVQLMLAYVTTNFLCEGGWMHNILPNVCTEHPYHTDAGTLLAPVSHTLICGELSLDILQICNRMVCS